MLVVIERRMGPRLREKAHAEDLWQETLLHAWRDRAHCKFTGVASFRRWLLGIIDHRISDLRDFFSAQKRASDRERPWNWASQEHGSSWSEEPLRTTTPSRLAMHREQADQMICALEAVEEPLRQVVRLRLFEGHTMPEVAEELGLGLSAAKHRYRRGAAQYRSQLFQRLGSRVDPNH